MNAPALTLPLPDEAATRRFGEDLAAILQTGDVVGLAGVLGAGKTALARAVIRARAGDDTLEVPSPTFTLVQTYDASPPVAHFDLYRLAGPDELDELGLEDAAQHGAVLVEWPERAGDRLPADALRIRLDHGGDGGRIAVIDATGAWRARIGRTLTIRAFLDGAGHGIATRRPLAGDASTRAYETVTTDGETRVLMNAPPMPDGPPIRDGKPYSRIAHLAESVTPFVAVARALRAAGFCAPQIHAADLDQGLLLLEHLGAPVFLAPDGAPVAERYVAAAELLAAVHATDWPRDMEAAPGVIHTVPDYDRGALGIELDLLTDWYLPYVQTGPPDSALKRDYAAGWDTVLDSLAGSETSLVLRDYHSPNLIWRAGRTGTDRIGLIDFQDAVFGSAAYDVASLAQDARVTIPAQLEARIVDAYCAARTSRGTFNRDAFEHAYAIMAAQRNSKILGIFVRLDRRDGKPAYLQHLPRIRAYLARVLGHRALDPVRAIYARLGIGSEP